MTVQPLLKFSMKPGPHMLIVDKPRVPGIIIPDGYIDFTKSGRLTTLEETKKLVVKKEEKKKPTKPAVNEWLRMTTTKYMRGKDTALSAALMAACVNKIIKDGRNAGDIIRPVIERETRERGVPRQSKPEVVQHPVTPSLSITKDTSWKLYKDGWTLDSNGVFFRTRLGNNPDGTIHSIHVGSSVRSVPRHKKTAPIMPAYEQARYDAAVRGEVSCG